MKKLGAGTLAHVVPREEQRRLTLAALSPRHPELGPALRGHPHVCWLLVRSERDGPIALGARGAHYLAEGR